MKRKLLACLLTATMAVGLFTGCAATKKSATTKTDGETAEDTGSPAPEWGDYDKLIDEIRKDTDFEDREAKMHEAEDMLMDTGAVLPLYYYNDMYVQRPGIEGTYSNLFGYKYFMYEKKDGQPMDQFKLNLASEPDHLDPALNSSVDGACLAVNSFAGLYTFDKDMNIIPGLADGEPEVSEDGTEYTVKVKQGLKWSDGSKLDANDVVYSWKRAANPATASDYAYLFSVFEGYQEGDEVTGNINVELVDDNTFKFKLNAPCAYMESLMAFPVFFPVPQAAVEAAPDHDSNPGAWTAEAGFVSSGAFTLKEWKHNEYMIYEKNPNYYDAANVTVDKLYFMLSADDTAIYSAYQNGDIDFADTVPNNEIANLKGTDDFHVVPNLGTYYVGFNVYSEMFDGMTAENASKMRRALGLLIDRQYICDKIGQTDQEPALTFIPTGMSDGHGGEFRTNDDAYTYPVEDAKGYYENKVDTEQAVKLLKEAGFKFDDNNMLSSETPINIKYLTNEGSGHEAIAQAIQQDFAKIGVTTEISTEDWQTFLNDRKSGNFDVAREGWLADYDDPINMLEMFTSDSGNNDMQLGKSADAAASAE